ncbi:MAG: SET domain-containing protein [Candidatus Aenigmarchaeota archaeon]|nr:SET domain-containing protein [Candidatus Aenigmarchaeota archaeon]
MFVSKKLELEGVKGGKGLFAKEYVRKDEILIRFKGNFLGKATRTSLQIGENKHLEGPGKIDDFLNHSCEPNGYIDFGDMNLRALRRIRKGEEVTFNYLTTEWDMKKKFRCGCGSKKCLRFIRGFKYLTAEQKGRLEPLLSPFLKGKLKESFT